MSCPPTHFYVPDGAVFTLADEVADLMEAIGYQVGEAERLTCHALYAQRADGRFIGLESGVVGPRQNLKTSTMIAGAIHDTFVQGLPVNWTAHEFKTSTAAFRDFQGIIEANEWLSSEVKAIRTANGNEGFDLLNGARLNIIARTGKSGRGMAIPRLYLDEGLYLTGKMMGAIIPTMSAMPNAHAVVGSSPGLMDSLILRGMRDRARAGNDPHLGWIEWSQAQQDCASPECDHAVGTEGCWLDDLDAVLRVNPAAPHRISIDYLLQERRTLSSAPEEYLRERMGVWSDPPEDGAGTVFPLESWRRCGDDRSGIADESPISLAVDVSWDRSMAYVVAFGANAHGIPHGQLIHHGSPSDVVAYIADLCTRRPIRGVAVQASSAPASSLVPDLERDVPAPLFAMQTTDLQRACGMAYDRISAEQVRHSAQPLVDRAVGIAEARPLSDGWVLDRKRSRLDIAGLVAWVNALWLHQTFEEEVTPAPFVIF